VNIVRGVLLALLGSLLTGLVIGTAIRLRLEQPVRYFVHSAAPAADAAGDLTLIRHWSLRAQPLGQPQSARSCRFGAVRAAS
jgi:hypothetical protein